MRKGNYWYRAKYYYDFPDFIDENERFLYLLRCGVCGCCVYVEPSVGTLEKCPLCGTEMTEEIEDDIIPYHFSCELDDLEESNEAEG